MSFSRGDDCWFPALDSDDCILYCLLQIAVTALQSIHVLIMIVYRYMPDVMEYMTVVIALMNTHAVSLYNFPNLLPHLSDWYLTGQGLRLIVNSFFSVNIYT